MKLGYPAPKLALGVAGGCGARERGFYLLRQLLKPLIVFRRHIPKL